MIMTSESTVTSLMLMNLTHSPCTLIIGLTGNLATLKSVTEADIILIQSDQNYEIVIFGVYLNYGNFCN